MSNKYVILKPGRERSALRRHPWIFSNGISEVAGGPETGETIIVKTSRGDHLGQGAYSPSSQIAIRFWSFDPGEEISLPFFRQRLESAIRSRGPACVSGDQSACRLVNAESDGLPGLVVDRYAGFLVCQFLSAGAEQNKQLIITALKGLVPHLGIYERSDSDMRLKEGLLPLKGVLSGKEPPERVEICEGACRFFVDIKRGQKTGFYLDQRENRECLARYANGREVLNCFSYTGGFSIWALSGGASHVVDVESSLPSIELARENVALNGFEPGRVEYEHVDVFECLRRFYEANRGFDIVILDPPKFVKSRGHLERASRGYKDINRLAFKLIKPFGLLFTFSCSELMPLKLFQKIVADAALDAGCEAHIIRRLTQSPDHPVALNFPEGGYLKGLVCRIIRSG